MLKNISEFPRSIQPILVEFTHQLLENLGENVLSVVVYGSAAGTNYQHGVSDINLAVIVRNLDFPILKQSLGAVKSARRKKIAAPLFLTRDYILNSLDVFPIEFSEIKEQHKVILGEDVFKDLDIPLKDVRLLCEQQVKGKLLHLRQAFLETGPNPSVLKNFLIRALGDLVPVFRQLVILKGQKPNALKEELLGQLAVIFSLDLQPFSAVLQDKSRKLPMAAHQVEAHFQNFLAQLEKLSLQMDSL